MDIPHEAVVDPAQLAVAHEQVVAAVQAAQGQHHQDADVASAVNGAAAAIQAAAAVAAATAWANATAVANVPGMPSITDNPSEGSLDYEGSGKSGSSKMRRAAWTSDEEDRLKSLAERYSNAGQRMCWRLIAQELGTGRSSKQCREHYLNSLRPNMKKGQWTQQEEYIIAREHMRNGSHWCIIAKKLPGRTDNSIKNFYNATVRSKAVNKNESFLWLYVDKVHRQNLPPKDAFALAKDIWSASVSPQLAQEVFSMAEDGLPDTLHAGSKRKPEEDIMALVQAGMVPPDKIPQVLAMAAAGRLEDFKRQKLDQGVQERQRQELLQQLGIAPQQPDIQVIQQQLLLQQLIAAAANNSNPPAQQTPPPSLPAPGNPAGNQNNLIALMQQITAQSMVLSSQQQPAQQQVPGNASLQQMLGLQGGASGGGGGANSMLAQLLMQEGAAGAAHFSGADATAAAAIAAAAAAGMEHVGEAHEVKQEHDNSADQHVLQAAAAIAAQATQQALQGGMEHHAHESAHHAALLGHLTGMPNLANVSADAVLAALPSGELHHQ